VEKLKKKEQQQKSLKKEIENEWIINK